MKQNHQELRFYKDVQELSSDKNFFPILTIMLYISKTNDYLNIFTEDEVKDFVSINFSKYFKSSRKNCILN